MFHCVVSRIVACDAHLPRVHRRCLSLDAHTRDRSKCISLSSNEIVARRRYRYNFTEVKKQVAQLSQRDRPAAWVSYGPKWKTVHGRQYLGHYRSVFNHCDVIGQQSNRVR